MPKTALCATTSHAEFVVLQSALHHGTQKTCLSKMSEAECVLLQTTCLSRMSEAELIEKIGVTKIIEQMTCMTK